MTDEHYESLRRYILDLKVEVAELKLMLKRQNAIADHRHKLLYEWCAPASCKEALESELSLPGEDVEAFLDRIELDRVRK